jgi:hypothetical protein
MAESEGKFGMADHTTSGPGDDMAAAQSVTVESPQIASQFLPEANDDPHALR